MPGRSAEQSNKVAFERFAHDEVNDWVLCAVRMSEQQRQWRHELDPARTGVRRRRAGGSKAQVQVDDVVGQPERGEQTGDDQ